MRDPYFDCFLAGDRDKAKMIRFGVIEVDCNKKYLHLPVGVLLVEDLHDYRVFPVKTCHPLPFLQRFWQLLPLKHSALNPINCAEYHFGFPADFQCCLIIIVYHPIYCFKTFVDFLILYQMNSFERAIMQGCH